MLDVGSNARAVRPRHFDAVFFHQGNDVVVKVHQGVGQDGGRNRIADFKLAERIEVDLVDGAAC